jgi:hypothetical protein
MSTCESFSDKRFCDATEESIALGNLSEYRLPDVKSIIRILDPGQIRLLNRVWEHLQADLLAHELRTSSTITVPVFLTYFHGYE